MKYEEMEHKSKTKTNFSSSKNTKSTKNKGKLNPPVALKKMPDLQAIPIWLHYKILNLLYKADVTSPEHC